MFVLHRLLQHAPPNILFFHALQNAPTNCVEHQWNTESMVCSPQVPPPEAEASEPLPVPPHESGTGETSETEGPEAKPPSIIASSKTTDWFHTLSADYNDQGSLRPDLTVAQ